MISTRAADIAWRALGPTLVTISVTGAGSDVGDERQPHYFPESKHFLIRIYSAIIVRG